MRRALAAAVLAACTHEPPAPHEVAHPTLETFELASPPGLSDLTLAEDGHLWAMPERDRVLVDITLGARAATTRLVPLDGVPDGVDTEGLAWLGGGNLAISTEGQEVPTAGVLWAELRAGRAVVTARRELTSAELGVTLTNNHGAEAICGTPAALFVGIEAVGKLADGTRWAPIARIQPGTETGALTVFKFRLTTTTGKVSALACTIAASGEVRGWAIERHYGVRRILRFVIPADAAAGAELTPTLALDLAPIVPDSFNLEGIVELPDGRVILVNDNQSSKIEGPSELFVFRGLVAR